MSDLAKQMRDAQRAIKSLPAWARNAMYFAGAGAEQWPGYAKRSRKKRASQSERIGREQEGRK